MENCINYENIDYLIYKKFNKENGYYIVWKNKNSNNFQWVPSYIINKNLNPVEVNNLTSSEKRTDFKELNKNFNSNDKTFGSFKFLDTPKQIMKMRKKNNTIEFNIEWKNRGANNRPKNSIITNEELKINDPIFLLEFYEKNINILNEEN